jgi:hypothetical protein
LKYSLLLFLLLPLPSFAQSGRVYGAPSMQRNMQSMQDFNRRTNQRTQDFQQQQMQRMQQRQVMRSGSPAVPRAQALANQQQLEQAANAQLAQLAQEQQRRREQNPAPDAQAAALQQRQDARQLTQLAVKNYREVFLPGQVTEALDTRQPTAQMHRQLRTLNQHLMSGGWWRKQAGAQLPAAVKAHGDTLRTLTTTLLGFEPAAPPLMPAPLSVSRLEQQLAADVFDQPAATQLVREAALSEKLLIGAQLAQAVTDFSRLSAAPGPNPARWRKDVQASLRRVNKAMGYYVTHINPQTLLYEAETTLLKSTEAYVAAPKGK